MKELIPHKRSFFLFIAFAYVVLFSIGIEINRPVLAEGKTGPDLIAFRVDRFHVLSEGESGGPELRFGLSTANIGNAPMQRPEDFDELAEFTFWKWNEASEDWVQIDVRRKRIICIIDTARVFPCIGPASGTFVCGNREQQGISVGWADDYFPFLRGQYVRLPQEGPIDGRYWLSVWENPDEIVEELNKDNNGYDVLIRIEGGVITYTEEYPGWKTPCP